MRGNLISHIDNLVLTEFLGVKRGMVTFLNPYSYLVARKGADYFKDIDYIAIDSGLLAKLLSVSLRKKVNRLSFDFTSIANDVFQSLDDRGSVVYFVGSKEKDIEIFVQKLAVRYPSLNISGYRNGYFADSEEMEHCVRHILNDGIDAVVVGMGAGLQEKFLSVLKKAGWTGSGYTCGGFMHQMANTENAQYYPVWINNFGLRWAYRIYDEPKLIRRYLYDYGRFVPLFIWDLIIYKSK